MTNDLALLNRLFSSSESGEIAWKEFLQKYSNLFLKIIWQFEKDHDQVMEKYLYVCSKFAEKDFAILRKFTRLHGDNPPKFTTWLGAVVRNMCVDAYRSAQGRRRIPKALQRFPDVDKRVFELYYWRGFTVEEIDRELATRRNGSGESVADILERLEASLLRPPPNPSTAPMTIRLPYNDETVVMTTSPAAVDQETLDRWLNRLSTDERLLIQLKFWDDLSALEIGEVLKIASEERIQELLKKAMKNLRAIAEKEHLA
jgi:DNA-directed RNA polymerase specialized sigma24 family protein